MAGLLLAAVPFAADPFLRVAVRALGALSVGGFLGSLVAVLVLVAVPVLLLGTVAPYANRLAVGRVAQTGTVTGRLCAISTMGSLLATFASALLLIPLIGTHRTFLSSTRTASPTSRSTWFTREFFTLVHDHLRSGGAIIVNVGHIPGSSSLERVVSATLRAVFPSVVRYRISDTNSLVIASNRALSGERMQEARRRAGLPADLDPLALRVAGGLAPPLRGGAVYTDDRAPVEWLTDLSILRYATGTR